MNDLVKPTSLLPLPRAEVTIREATVDDVPFIDSLQKTHRKQVGFMPEGQIIGKIKARDVIVAWASGPCSSVAAQEKQNMGETPMPREEAVGYCIGTDRYFKHDDVGIIYHLNVVPGRQRGFVGATLLGAMFDRAAYGCKLYCCWCAQDIEANRFWESMGFVPLAFRAGSERKSRVHIFWQKRIRAGDTTTPWWFPAKTDAGAMREDRLVLPIPPGKHWSDEMPRILPAETPQLALDPASKGRGRKAAPSTEGPVKHGPRQFGPPPTTAALAQKASEKPEPQKKPKRKADPAHVAAARELRDRWLEQANSYQLVGAGKYDVSRVIAEMGGAERAAITPLLAA